MPADGTGSADVSGLLLSLLSVVHVKAQAALAADAAEVRSEASVTASSDADEKMKDALSEAEDVVSFAASRACVVLQVHCAWLIF